MKDKGPWEAGADKNHERVFVQSEDFTHDVRLYVDGDFRNYEERIEYAREIARALNAQIEVQKIGGDFKK